MSLPKYVQYKDSGTDWLGEAPSHWSVVPLWTLFRRTKRTGFKSEQLLSVYRDFGVVPKASRDDNNNKPSDDLSVYQLVEPGDLAINKMKAWQGAVAISEHRGIVSPAYFIYGSTHSESARYLHYLLRSPRYITGYLSLSKGIRVNQWDLEPQYHSRMPVLLPPKEEQTAIAAFLDRETAKIDALIAEQEKLITLLAEKRQSTISQAVTKGLNPNVPMKDSGVAWLGEVPAHWRVLRLRFIVDIETGNADTADATDEGEFPFFVRSQTVERIGRYTHDCEAVLTAGDGAGVGKVFHHFTGKFCAHQRVYIFKNFRGISGKWFFEYLRALFYRVVLEGTAKSTVDSLRRPMIADFPITIPSAEEMTAIERHIERESSKFEQLIQEAGLGIDLLKERRTALIAAAVTGQIDVRSVMAQALDESPEAIAA